MDGRWDRPAGGQGSFRHVSPSADALIHRVEELGVDGDRSLVQVIAFMIVAEFGVLSSVTVSAPDPQIGLGFFVLFLVGSAIFVRHPYREYATALYHLAVGVVTAVMSASSLATSGPRSRSRCCSASATSRRPAWSPR